MLTVTCALGLASCSDSSPSNSLPLIDIPAAPRHVRAVADMPPVLIPGKLNSDAERNALVAKLRISELRYRRALRHSVAHYDRVRKGVAKATAKSKPTTGLFAFAGN